MAPSDVSEGEPKLEEQLRDLILGNVRIGQNQVIPQTGGGTPSHPRHQRGGYRGSRGSPSHRYRGGWTGQSGERAPGDLGRDDGDQVYHGRSRSEYGRVANGAHPGIPRGQRTDTASMPPERRVEHQHRHSLAHGRSVGFVSTQPFHGTSHDVQISPVERLDQPREGHGTQRRGHFAQGSPRRGTRGFRGGYHTGPRPPPPAIFIAQCEYLDRVASTEIARVQMGFDEYTRKDGFREMLQRGFQQTLTEVGLSGHEILSLRGFGSFSSGFATADSDVDLAVVLEAFPGQSQDDAARLIHDLPRMLEKALLDAGFGARLLSRTRVPIIKTCQAPTSDLLYALREERAKWDALPEDEKYTTSIHKDDEQSKPEPTADDPGWRWKDQGAHEVNGAANGKDHKGDLDEVFDRPKSREHQADAPLREFEKIGDQSPRPLQDNSGSPKARPKSRGKQKPWLRERPRGPLDFPKAGVGIQVDINFSNPLALHNTEMLRCYAISDPRVQPFVLFVKAWAKRRKINSSYNGTLSSYGFVLMVLHFLINVTQPPVLPNLQLTSARLPPGASDAPVEWQSLPDQGITCDGYQVNFWRDQDQIRRLAQAGLLTQNSEPLGSLLRNFFHYYAHQGHSVVGSGFQWTAEVLSLRTAGGILSKEEKGWVGAKTTMTDNREVRHRYLFAIEDPFELEHNVARTVTHNGIVAIRDEFRRAWRILAEIGGRGESSAGHLFDAVVEVEASHTDTEGEQDKPQVEPFKESAVANVGAA